MMVKLNEGILFIEDDDLLNKYNTIWDKVSADITKISSYGDEATDFHDKELPKAGSNHTCLAVITVDSALKKDKYYLQAFLKECKYIEKEKEVINFLRL